jgi:ABC-type taurine transport system substrate-binding protein
MDAAAAPTSSTVGRSGSSPAKVFPARVVAVEAHFLEEAIDDAEKILVVVDRLIRTHTDTLL